MNKIIFFVFFTFFWLGGVFAQKQHVVKCRVKTNASACGLCNHKPIKNVELIEHKIPFLPKSHGRIVYDGIGGNYMQYNVWHQKYIVINEGAVITFSFHDPTGGGDIELEYQSGPGLVDFIPYADYHHNNSGFGFYHSVWLNAEAETYDPMEITSIKMSSCVDDNECSGDNLCVESINENIDVHLKVTNQKDNASLWVYAYVKNETGFTQIDREYLGNPENMKSFSFSSLNLQDYWGKDIYFRISTGILSSVYIFSDYKRVQFFKQIPNPVVSYHKKACNPQFVVKLTLDDYTIDHLGNKGFKLRACEKGKESTSVPAILNGEVSGNTITIEMPEIFSESDSITIQIYQDVHGTPPPKMEDILCARNIYLRDIDPPPIRLSLSSTLKEYTFTDDNNNTHTYHITRYDVNDGEATITLSGGESDRVDYFQYSTDNANWSSVTNIQNVNNTTYSYPNLSEEKRWLKVFDKDGCVSDSIDFTPIKPEPITIDSIRSTLVTCHAGNTGTGSKTDAKIRVYWKGGIGPYDVVINNSLNNTVYNNDAKKVRAFNLQTNKNNIPVGEYQVLITDTFNVNMNENHIVSSNPEVKLSTTIKPYDCYNSGDGTVLLKVEGHGTEFVDFSLSGQNTRKTDLDTTRYTDLPKGNYTASVINTRNCEDIIENITITQPNKLELSATQTNPVCYNSFNGYINTNTLGGNGNYQFLWSNGETTPDISGLNSGHYTLKVVDDKGCSDNMIFDIIPPDAPTAGWEETSAVLCTGNTKTLDGGDYVDYEWRKDDKIVSIDRYYTLAESGTYTLKLTNSFACVSTDTFNLELSDHPLDAVLLLQDSAYVNELLEAIDVTWPVPDSISWYFDKAVVLDNSNEWSQQFLVEEKGLVNVTLRAWSGGCFSDSSKTVTIFNDEDGFTEKQTESSPLILGFKAYPNPNDGNFKIAVKLSKDANISLKIYSLQTNSVIHTKKYKGLNTYEIPYQLNNLNTGVYLIILNVEHEQQSMKIVIGN